MQRILLFVSCLLFVVFADLAGAWEFRMRGEFEYRNRYWNRTGGKDLFGDANHQNSRLVGTAYVGFAGPNWWSSNPSLTTPIPNANANDAITAIVRGGFSSAQSDAGITDMRLTVYPSIQINPAVNIYSTFTIGGFRNKYKMMAFQVTTAGFTTITQNIIGIPPFERYYASQTSDSAFNTAALISVEQLKAVIQLPFGLLAIGTKDFPIGVGATYARNSREESIYIIVPYGPLAFHTYLFPFQQVSLRSLGTTFPHSPTWDQSADPGRHANLFFGQAVTYAAGSWELGFLCFLENSFIEALSGVGRSDLSWYQGMAWAKYYDGRIFLNGEYVWENSVHRIMPSGAVGALGSPFGLGALPAEPGSLDSERYHAFLEIGTTVGPAKLSLLWAQASGPDFGVLLQNPTKYYCPLYINYQAMYPYNYLMFHTYAGGNNRFSLDGTGEMADAVAFGGRLDYMVAANLNFWGSFLWAHRLERNGTLAGQYSGSVTGGGAPTLVATGTFTRPQLYQTWRRQAQAWKSLNTGFPAAGLNPCVDDGLIGYEVNVGMDWKLLEGVRWSVRYAFWQPGPWFDQAYKAVTSELIGGLVGNKLMKGRSSIQAFESSLMLSF